MRKLLYLLSLLLCMHIAFATDIPAKPNTLVNDYAGVLSSSSRASLEQMLEAYDDSTSNQITIVIEQSLNGEEPYTRSVDIAEKWGVGDAKKDNGILIYVAIADHKIWIQIGRGLEGAIPDALVARIIDNEITPYFKKGDYYEGLHSGCLALFKAAQGEYKADKKKHKDVSIPWWMIMLFFFIVFLIGIFKGRSRRGTFSRRGYWGKSTWGGGWGGGFGGWGGGGSSGGGGWGGFGGGSFGGGGAGGSW